MFEILPNILAPATGLATLQLAKQIDPGAPLTLRIEQRRQFPDSPLQVRQEFRIRFRAKQESREFACVTNLEHTGIIFT